MAPPLPLRPPWPRRPCPAGTARAQAVPSPWAGGTQRHRRRPAPPPPRPGRRSRCRPWDPSCTSSTTTCSSASCTSPSPITTATRRPWASLRAPAWRFWRGTPTAGGTARCWTAGVHAKAGCPPITSRKNTSLPPGQPQPHPDPPPSTQPLTLKLHPDPHPWPLNPTLTPDPQPSPLTPQHHPLPSLSPPPSTPTSACTKQNCLHRDFILSVLKRNKELSIWWDLETQQVHPKIRRGDQIMTSNHDFFENISEKALFLTFLALLRSLRGTRETECKFMCSNKVH